MELSVNPLKVPTPQNGQQSTNCLNVFDILWG